MLFKSVASEHKRSVNIPDRMVQNLYKDILVLQMDVRASLGMTRSRL